MSLRHAAGQEVPLGSLPLSAECERTDTQPPGGRTGEEAASFPARHAGPGPGSAVDKSERVVRLGGESVSGVLLFVVVLS